MMRAPETDLPIVLDRVTLRAGAVTILDGLSLTLAAGAPTVVIGPNGAGKTTLLRLAMALARPTEGRITWGGRTEAPPTRRAFVFQRPVMLRRSTAGNIAYALASADVPRPERPARIIDLLDRVGLRDLASRPARRLSGGEQQRLSIARALARNPSVLFLDEPAASLDPAASKAIEDLIREIAASGVKVVMATHDLGSARRLAGEIVLMHRGRIVETGAADAFFAGPRTAAGRTFIAGDLLI
jgi:tungstate transport system ATP-binding protein